MKTGFIKANGPCVIFVSNEGINLSVVNWHDKTDQRCNKEFDNHIKPKQAV